MKEFVFGIDAGNARVKGYSDKGGVVFSSAIAMKRDVMDSNVEDINFISKSDNMITFSSIRDEGEEYVWGPDIHNLEIGDELIRTNIGEERYQTKYFRLLCDAIQGYLIKQNISEITDETYKVNLVMGIPSKEKGTNQEKHLADAIEGNHIVTIDGREITFKTNVLKIVSQPLGTLFDKILNGKEELTEKYVGIIDVGGGTVDIDGINKLKVNSDDRFTFKNKGAYGVYDDLSNYVNSQNTAAEATPEKVERQIDNDAYKASDVLTVPFKKEKERIIKGRGNKLINDIKLKWQNLTKFDRVILTGGGSEFFKEAFFENIPNLETAENPQLANARGFYKFANFLIEEKEGESTETADTIESKEPKADSK